MSSPNKTIKLNRYAYEKAEEVLGAFAESMREEFPAFHRAYRKFRGVVCLYAVVDSMTECPGLPREQALAWAWEDADVAFRGYGEAILTGPIIQMWDCLGDDPKRIKQFKRVLTEAFSKANESTHVDVRRRYLMEDRQAPIRTLDDGFDEGAITPSFGVTLREFVSKNGFEMEGQFITDDPDEAEMFLSWLFEIEKDQNVIEVATARRDVHEVAKDLRAKLHVLRGDKE